jgi:hypothetical protein
MLNLPAEYFFLPLDESPGAKAHTGAAQLSATAAGSSIPDASNQGS